MKMPKFRATTCLKRHYSRSRCIATKVGFRLRHLGLERGWRQQGQVREVQDRPEAEVHRGHLYHGPFLRHDVHHLHDIHRVRGNL